MRYRITDLAFRRSVAVAAVLAGAVSLAGCSSLGSRSFIDPAVTGSTGQTVGGCRYAIHAGAALQPVDRQGALPAAGRCRPPDLRLAGDHCRRDTSAGDRVRHDDGQVAAAAAAAFLGESDIHARSIISPGCRRAGRHRAAAHRSRARRLLRPQPSPPALRSPARSTPSRPASRYTSSPANTG